jgi:hypothetical protein
MPSSDEANARHEERSFGADTSLPTRSPLLRSSVIRMGAVAATGAGGGTGGSGMDEMPKEAATSERVVTGT